MASPDVHVRICEQEILKYDLEIKALIQVRLLQLPCRPGHVEVSICHKAAGQAPLLCVDVVAAAAGDSGCSLSAWDELPLLI